MTPGDRYGRLVAIRRVGKNKSGNSIWSFSCDCGAIHECVAASVTRGSTKSCGCLRRETTGGKRKHGASKSSEYRIWAGMLLRCDDPKTPHYDRYGGRGIRVCLRWRSFSNFLEDMGPRPEGLSLDRIDNDGNYEPGNCRWAHSSTQANNRSSNRRITYNARTQTLRQWADEKGISAATLARRLNSGWSIPTAMETPVRVWGS